MSKRKVETSQLKISSVLKRLIAEMFSLSKLQGHAKVESLLITAFEKFYYDRLLKIDSSDPQTMVEEVKKLALGFINNLPNSTLDDIDKISDGFGILNYYLAGWGNVVVDYLESFISSLQDIIPSTIQEEQLLLRALESLIDFRGSYHYMPFYLGRPSGPNEDPDDEYYGGYHNNSTPDHSDYHGYIIGYNVTDL